MRILLRGNMSSIEVEGSQEMESERGLISCKAEMLLQDLFEDSCLIDADQFRQDHELIGCDLTSCLECISSACHV
jgi:hypothetical protein